jgi:hypothetical protein
MISLPVVVHSADQEFLDRDERDNDLIIAQSSQINLSNVSLDRMESAQRSTSSVVLFCLSLERGKRWGGIAL